jgi:integrase
MVLRMACPTKRTGSDNWYFRRQIPKDVKAILAKLPKAKWPRNWYRDHISISLKTADRAKAKASCPEIAAEIETQIAALRGGPKALSHKQIAALSGELYKSFANGLEENPVLSPEQWLKVAEGNVAAREGRFALRAEMFIGRTQSEQRRASLERRFGQITDAFLSKQGILIDEDSRQKLIERLSVDLSVAAKKLARNAAGDYTPDTYAAKFPPFDQGGDKGASSKSLKALAEAWHKAALDRDVKKRDADRIKSRFETLIAFLKHDNAERVTRKDIVRWRDYRLANKISAKTINDTDIASFKNVFNWGVEREWLSTNPAEKATLRKKKSAKLRDEYFDHDEAKAILTRAASITGTPRENQKTTAAKRWVPWLCAYSGARVSEVIQLRKKDIRKDTSNGWILRLTPEAGGIKTNTFCDIPVHEHLVATGFIDFVKTSKDGHLFCNPAKGGSITGPAEGIYKRIYSMVRAVVVDPRVQPNHAWRYTFKTLGLEAGIEEVVLDAISNHAPKHQGGKYTKVTLKTRANAMAKFPRYPLA